MDHDYEMLNPKNQVIENQENAQTQNNKIQNESRQSIINVGIYSLFALSVIYMAVCLLTLQEHPIVGYNKTSASPITITETIPDILNNTRTNPETYETWLWLINNATTSIDIVAYYSTMFCENTTSNTCKNYAAQVVNALKTAANDRTVKIRMVIDGAAFGDFSDITKFKQLFGDRFQVKYVNISHLFNGIQHQKIILQDQKGFYLGSANFDWRALTEVKEIGVYVNDQNLAFDVQQIFEQLFAEATDNNTQLISLQDAQQKYLKIFNNFTIKFPYVMNQSQVFIGQSPTPQLAFTRTHDLDAIQQIMDNATQTLDIQCMDYAPMMLYTKPSYFWDKFESHVKAAALRGVKVRLLMQYLDNTTNPLKFSLINSLAHMPNITVYMMNMPKLNETGGWDHTRLIHSKFVNADASSSAISTSNWTGDYFETTCGATIIVIGNTGIGQNLKQVMDRDVQSQYVVRFKPV